MELYQLSYSRVFTLTARPAVQEYLFAGYAVREHPFGGYAVHPPLREEGFEPSSLSGTRS